MNEQKDSAASEGIPERVWVSNTIAVSGLNRDYYLSNTNFSGDGIEYARVHAYLPSVEQANEIVDKWEREWKPAVSHSAYLELKAMIAGALASRSPVTVDEAVHNRIVQAITDCEEGRLSHLHWAEHFEAHPELEKQYEQTGEWDTAKIHRDWVAKYNNIIYLLARVPYSAPSPTVDEAAVRRAAEKIWSRLGETGYLDEEITSHPAFDESLPLNRIAEIILSEMKESK